MRVAPRLVEPEPSKALALLEFRRLASAPLGLFLPRADATVAWALEVRADLVAPVATAEAFSLTTIVTRSSTCVARTSLPRSVRWEAGDHREPADGPVGGAGVL